jgi:hypothetical protein
MSEGRFEAVVSDGLAAVRAGSHGIEDNPRVTGRWGPSIVLLPRGEVAHRLAGLASTAGEILEDSHWLSGGVGRAHLTVRALEPYAVSIDADRLQRYRIALQRALREIGSLRFEFRGLGISAGSVMVRAIPLSRAADVLRQRLGAELGPDGWLEDDFFENGRDPIWYCSILHYAAALSNVEDLVNWIDRQADGAVGACTFDSVEICTWKYTQTGMVPQVTASLPAAGEKLTD